MKEPKLLMCRVYLGRPSICHNVAVNTVEHSELVDTIRCWATELGLQDIGFTGIELNQHEASLQK